MVCSFLDEPFTLEPNVDLYSIIGSTDQNLILLLEEDELEGNHSIEKNIQI